MKNKKILIPIIAGVAVLVAVITVICIVVANKEEAYRIIKVYEIDGEAIVERDGKGEIEAYANMILESGDTVLLEAGTMTLKLDEDKYIYIEEGSELVLRAKGTAKNSKTTITLKQGAITNELQNKLNDQSSYELNTPNSTMSVRGTIYRAEVYESEDGNLHTRVSVSFLNSLAHTTSTGIIILTPLSSACFKSCAARSMLSASRIEVPISRPMDL